jgi:oligoendopeptidase F
MAENAGFPDAVDHLFRVRDRFDYTPDDCLAFHEVVEKTVLPAADRLDAWRRERLGLESLRPWDLEVDVEGRPPLRPCADAEDLVRRSRTIFERVDPVLAERFGWLAERGMLDLENRKGKAPGGFQVRLSEARFPFIFMNAVGTENDVRTLIHEGGHAFHTFEARDHDLPFNREYPLEFAEVASMSMELIASEHADVLYDDPDERRRSRLSSLERGVQLLPRVALVDAFQHWIYRNPDHTREERRAAWRDLAERFGGRHIDWSGLDVYRDHQWHRVLHFFHVPFYFIEYGLAQLGAWQVWRSYRTDPEEAIRRYRSGLALGNTRPLPDLYEAAGARFDFFRPEPVRDLVEFVSTEIEKLIPQG